MSLLKNQAGVVATEVARDATAEFPLGLMRRGGEQKSAAASTMRAYEAPERGRTAVLEALVRDGTGGRPRSGTGNGVGQRIVCGSGVCKTLWTPPWKSRLYPNFEGQWACSRRCLWKMVQAAIAREVGDGLAARHGTAAYP